MAKTTTAKRKTGTGSGFTADERAAMKERAREVKAERAGRGRAAGEAALKDAIAKMSGSDRAIGTKLHKLVSAAAPDLEPKTWYGMPAWAKDGKVLCFFQAAGKFKARYATLGFNDPANLDAGNMWPTAFALTKLTPAEEKKIVALVKKAVK